MIKGRKEESSIWQILQKFQTIVPIESPSPVVLHLDTKTDDQLFHTDEVQYLAEHSRRLLDGTEYMMKQYSFPTQPNHMPIRRSHERNPFERRQPIPDPRNTPHHRITVRRPVVLRCPLEIIAVDEHETEG